MLNPRYGVQPVKSPTNTTTGKPSAAAYAFTRSPGYLNTINLQNVVVKTIYALFYDQPLLPTANVAVGAPAYVAPKLVLTAIPAVSTTIPTNSSFDATVLSDTANYAGSDDYFKNGIVVAFSTDPAVYKPNPNTYPIALTGGLCLGKYTGFNPEMHAINIGQEPHPAIVENGVTVVQNGYFDTRPGGALQQMCQNLYADGWRNVRFNYVAPTFSKFQNWKDAALVVKSYFPNMRVGITASNGQVGGVTKDNFDYFISQIPVWVQWCVDNGIKRIAFANEEGNSSHVNVASYTSAGISDYVTYMYQKLFDVSLLVDPIIPKGIETGSTKSISFSSGEAPKVAALVASNYPHAIDMFFMNQYSDLWTYANNVTDYKTKFTINGVCRFGISEANITYGNFALAYGGTRNTGTVAGVCGDEHLLAIDMVVRRNVADALGLQFEGFCYIDHGVGGTNSQDQYGLVTITGVKHEAYLALLSA